MPSREETFIKRVLPTAHRVLLNRKLYAEAQKASGKVLILGAGHLDYSVFFSGTKSTLYHADLHRFGDHIDYVIDAHELTKVGKKFDFIFMLEVLEHVKDPDRVVSECFHSLREKGCLVLSVPFLYQIHGDPNDYWRFTASGLEKILCKFEQRMIEPFGNRVHTIFDLLTTGSLMGVPLRIFNHLLCLDLLSAPSNTSPSGYFIVCKK